MFFKLREPILRSCGQALAIYAIMAIASAPVMAQDMIEATSKPREQAFLPHSLAGHFYVLEVSKSAPMIHSKETIATRHATYYLGYRNQVAEDWMMGIGVSHRSFTKLTDPDLPEFSWFTLQHEAYYIVRVHHPLYLYMGPTLLYMLPTKQSYMPINRDPEFQSEFGVGGALALVLQASEQFLITAKVERWRGTRTNKFHAVSSSMGINYRL